MALSLITSDAEAITLYLKDWTQLVDAAVKYKRDDREKAAYQLARLQDKTMLSSDLYVGAITPGPLQYLLSAEHAAGEMVFNIQGVVAEICMMPVRATKRKGGFNKLNSFYQWVKITSYPDDKEFKGALEAIKNVYNFMAAACDDMGPRQHHYIGDLEAIRADSRLFTVRKETNKPGLDVPQHLDPMKLIKDVNRGGTHLYTEDNVVEVYERVYEKAKAKLEKINPAMIRAGDIVDIAVSFRIANGRSFLMHLESIILVNGKGSKELQKMELAREKVHAKPRKRQAIS